MTIKAEYSYRCPSSLYAVFEKAHIAPSSFLTNQSFVEMEGERGLRQIEALRGYRNYIESVRLAKATKGLSPAHEREIAYHARCALDHARSLIGSTLKLTRHLKQSGLLGDALSTWREALKLAGEIRIADLWADVLQIEEAEGVLAAEGISSDVVEELSAEIGKLDVKVFETDGSIGVMDNARGGLIKIRERPRPGLKGSITNLLTANQFDAVTEAWEARGQAGIAFTVSNSGAAADIVDPFDLVLEVALRADDQITRHVKSLNDVGVSRYEGKEPATIIAVAALVALILGFYLVGKYCETDSGSITVPDETKGKCIIGLLLIGVFIIVGIAFGPSDDFKILS